MIYLSLCPPFPLQLGDMSLGDNATTCLSAVITQLAAVGAGGQLYQDIVQNTILDAVHRGLQSKTDVGTPARRPISAAIPGVQGAMHKVLTPPLIF